MIVLLPFFVQSTISATLIKLFSLIQSSTACSVGVNFTPSFTVPFTVPLTVPFTVPFNEIFVLNTSPSINSGIVPKYTSVRFLHTIDCVRFMVPSSFKPRKISPPKRFRNAHNVSNTFFGKASLHSLNSIDIPSPWAINSSNLFGIVCQPLRSYTFPFLLYYIFKIISSRNTHPRMKNSVV